MGRFFGSKDHAPVNIAGMIMVLGIVGLIALPFLPNPTEGFSTVELAKVLAGIVLAAFTFLGGYLGGGKRD